VDITLSQCVVIVTDPDLAPAFYRDAPGLELRSDVPNEGFRWVTVGVHFHSDDLDPTSEKVRHSSAEIVQEPTDQPWGT
jgi:predicted enzyme related to lactoylglutathione lyase